MLQFDHDRWIWGKLKDDGRRDPYRLAIYTNDVGFQEEDGLVRFAIVKH